jgi:hypothetical protein
MRSRLYRRETYCLWPQQLWDIKERERFMMNFFIAGGPRPVGDGFILPTKPVNFSLGGKSLCSRRRIYLSGRAAQLRNAPLPPPGCKFYAKVRAKLLFFSTCELTNIEPLFTNAQTPRSRPTDDKKSESEICDFLLSLEITDATRPNCRITFRSLTAPTLMSCGLVCLSRRRQISLLFTQNFTREKILCFP